MKNIHLFLIILIAFFYQSCNQKYKNLEIGENEIEAYCTAYEKLNRNHKDFLIYISGREEIDSTVVKNYDEISQIIDNAGFIEPNLFLAVNNKISPVIEIIKNNSDVERYPGLSTPNLDFLETAAAEYRNLLKDTNLTVKKVEHYKQSLEQIESTLNNLTDKQKKNEKWINLTKKQAKENCNLDLSENSIMKLTIFEKEISEL